MTEKVHFGKEDAKSTFASALRQCFERSDSWALACWSVSEGKLVLNVTTYQFPHDLMKDAVNELQKRFNVMSSKEEPDKLPHADIDFMGGVFVPKAETDVEEVD